MPCPLQESGLSEKNREVRGCNQSLFFPLADPDRFLSPFHLPPEFGPMHKRRAPPAGNALRFLPLTWVTPFILQARPRILSSKARPHRSGKWAPPPCSLGSCSIPDHFKIACLYTRPLRGGKELTVVTVCPQLLVA